MFGLSARGLLNTVITLVFLVLSGLSALAFYLSRRYNLPIPLLLSFFSTALPFADWFTTFTTTSAFSSSSSQKQLPQSPHQTRKSKSPKKPLSTFLYTINLLLLILQSVSLTSNSTSLSPQLQQCTLEQQWQQWFSSKQGDTIKEVQDSLKCCGFNSVVDRPYPFRRIPKKNEDPKVGVPVETCAKSYGGVDKARACGAVWQGEMKLVATLYVIVSSVLAFWKFVMLVLAWGRPDILSTLFKKRDNHSDYRIIEEANDDEGDEEEGAGRRITNGTDRRITNGVNGHSNMNSESSRLIVARTYGATNNTASSSGEYGDDETGNNRNRLDERGGGGGVHVGFDGGENNNAWARDGQD
ncbi:hypothetical protein AA313_de0200163 [Arthrobotrys entomopaga]|nr:hypothetical protein AA313_de0200163 [Arthrobotrys entomopaga]